MTMVLRLTPFLLLAACGGQTPAENTSSQLEEAAEQSTPEAAEVLDDAAEQIEQQNISNPAAASEALNAAGNAQVN